MIHPCAKAGRLAGNLQRIHDHDMLNFGLRKDGANLAQLVVRGHKNHTSAGISHGVSRLFGGEGGIHRHRNGSEQQDRKIRGRPLWTILAENGNAIASIYAELLQHAHSGSHIALQVRRRNGKPLSRLAIKHGAREVALDGGKENIVQCGDAHELEISPELNLRVRSPIRQCERREGRSRTSIS